MSARWALRSAPDGMGETRLLSLFQDEARDHLDTIERNLLSLETGDRAGVEECLRRAHTLKGAARVVGMETVEECCHLLEDRLASFRKMGIPGPALVRELLGLVDRMRAEARAESPRAQEAAQPHPVVGAEMIRVEPERLDRMMRLVAGLRIGREKPDRAADPARARRLAAEAILLEQLDLELRAARLVPFSELALPMERTVREIAVERGLDARLDLEGGAVALDRAAIDALREPLMHLVRNALAHGIEPPDERSRRRKPATAVVRIKATRLGNRCRILVEDDGRGIDLAKLRESVSRAALLSPDEISSLPDSSLIDFVFHPAVSTASGVDSISGRGLGLEIVRTRLRAARGDARVLETGPDGTRFLLELPVHLQILPVLIVRSAGGLFGIPSASAEHISRTSEKEIRMIEGSPAVSDTGRTLRIISLARTLDARSPDSSRGREYVVIAAGERRVSLRVDEVEGESEVLLRDLEFPLAGLAPYSGAALTEDGRILLVLHPVKLLEMALSSAPSARPRSESRRRILVVDDSPTTRSLLRGVLSAAGYEVATASDGADAIRIFENAPAEIVVTDIEMPRMDGFQLARSIKAASRGRVPVLLVTSRDSDEDRRKGADAGADAYIVKSSFESHGLLEAVRRFA